MCLAYPGKIKSIKGEKGIVNFQGVEREIIVSFVDARKGDYVLVHAGIAIQKLNPIDAWEALKIYGDSNPK